MGAEERLQAEPQWQFSAWPEAEYEVTLEKVEVPEETQVWAQLKEEYNPRDASFSEMCSLSARLQEAGKISQFEYALLTFDPACVASLGRLPAAEERRDWIRELEGRLQRNRRMGNLRGYLCDLHLLELLQHLL